MGMSIKLAGFFKKDAGQTTIKPPSLLTSQVLKVSLEQTSLTQGERLRCQQATAKVLGKSTRRGAGSEPGARGFLWLLGKERHRELCNDIL